MEVNNVSYPEKKNIPCRPFRGFLRRRRFFQGSDVALGRLHYI